MMTATVANEAAEIRFEYEGEGPLLLFIPGAGRSGQRYAAVSTLLKDEHTVVCYDRHCNARSTGDRSLDGDIAQPARDPVAVMTAKIVSDVVGCTHRVISGHHLSYHVHAATFASEPRLMLRELKAAAPRPLLSTIP